MSDRVVILDPTAAVTVTEQIVNVATVGVPGPAGPPSLSLGAVTVGPSGDVLTSDGAAFVSLAKTVIDPYDYGATGDGSTNDSAAIQDALDAADALGGGVVLLRPGVFVCSGLLLDSNVTLMGSGVDATTLKAAASSNVPVVQTRDLATHTGTNNTTSEVNFVIADLTINGNKANNAGSNGYGVRVHGANFALRRIRVYDCNATGIDSEWSNSLSAPTTTGMQHSMEARLTDVEVHECDADGIKWNGPHDSMWDSVITWENATRGVYVASKGNATIMKGCHSWGNAQDYAFAIEATGCVLDACTGEGASVAQVLIRANDNQIIGGQYFAAGGGKGIVIGTVTTFPDIGGTMILTKVMNCITGAIDFAESAGGNVVRLHVYQTSGTVIAGSPDVADDYEVISTGTVGNRQARHIVQHAFLGGIAVKTKAGVPTDADMEDPMTGGMILDTTNSRIYFRVNTTWKYAALT
jgi:hypothetical protein